MIGRWPHPTRPRGSSRLRAAATGGLAALLVVMVLIGSAGAQRAFHPTTKVVLFAPAPSDPLVARLDAELAAVGIQVRKLAAPPESLLAAVVARELGAGASAAIRIVPRSRGAEVWTGATTTLILRPAARLDTSDGDLSVVALRTVEFLRATLLGAKGKPTPAPPVSPGPGKEEAQPVRETAGAPPPEPSSAPTAVAPSPARSADAPAGPTTPAVPAPPAPPVEAAEPPVAQPPLGTPEVDTTVTAAAPVATVPLEIAAGPAVLVSAGGLSPVKGVAVIGRARFGERAGIELMSILPLVPGSLTNPEGTVEVKTALFGAAALFVLTSTRHVRADAAVGGAALMTRAAGTAAQNPDVALFAGARTSWTGLAHLRLGGGLALNRWLSLRADGIGGLAASRTVIGYDVTDTAGQTTRFDRGTWGRAFAVVTVALQARW